MCKRRSLMNPGEPIPNYIVQSDRSLWVRGMKKSGTDFYLCALQILKAESSGVSLIVNSE